MGGERMGGIKKERGNLFFSGVWGGVCITSTKTTSTTTST